MIGQSWAVAYVFVAVAYAGCTETPGASASGANVVDSAGVQIVTNLPGAMESADEWSLSAEPVVDIGSGADADVPLFRVSAVTPLEDGRVGVGMNRPPQALVFHQDGTLAATLGGEGQGPGEFSEVVSIVALPSDSLAVWDATRRRMSVFTGDGRYVREVDLSELAPGPSPNVLVTGGTSALLPGTRGHLVLFGLGILDGRLGVKRVEAPTYRITTDGEEVAKFGSFPGLTTYLGPGGGAFVPFGARSYAATSGAGLAIGTAEIPEFLVFSPEGSPERIVRWPDHDRTVQGPFLERWSVLLERWLELQPAAQRDRFREYAKRLPKAELFPAYDGLIVSDIGEIWVGEYAGPLGAGTALRMIRVPARRWLVFDSDGTLIGRVPTPQGFQPHAVREGQVWGVFKDEFDVESVRAYRIEKG